MISVRTSPFPDQRPGTSGLRKKTRVFQQQNYLENFVQSVFDTVRQETGLGFAKETLVVGGDGRYHNRTAIQTILRMGVANGFGGILIARDGILSTPAMSAVIRRRGALGGLILSASHNPGGPDADFGIKYNTRNGGPAPERITGKIYKQTQQIQEYFSIDCPEIDLRREATSRIGETEVTVFDPLADYTQLMQELFDFDAIRGWFRNGFRVQFDAMHGVTGPYALHILEGLLDSPSGTVLHGTPLEDFGGHHPDPNLAHAGELVSRMRASDSADFGAACDGDGDRNMILGRNLFVSPGDSLAVIVQHAQRWIPGYRKGLAGVARSMPTSLAVDRVARSLGIPCYETPTGWKFFGNLMDAGKCTICGEESFGTGSDHIREKDGLWAVLCWLSILASTRKSVADLMHDHWRVFGRSYFQRHDFEALDLTAATRMIAVLGQRLPSLTGLSLAGTTVDHADDFSYVDPVDGSESTQQGIRIFLQDSSRIVCRLSGTGTHGATLRVYLERYRNDGGTADISKVLAPLAQAAKELLQLKLYCGTDQPTVIT